MVNPLRRALINICHEHLLCAGRPEKLRSPWGRRHEPLVPGRHLGSTLSSPGRWQVPVLQSCRYLRRSFWAAPPHQGRSSELAVEARVLFSGCRWRQDPSEFSSAWQWRWRRWRSPLSDSKKPHLRQEQAQAWWSFCMSMNREDLFLGYFAAKNGNHGEPALEEIKLWRWAGSSEEGALSFD